ncbi:MAG: class I SAM-dependent methyltransferase [Minwuiales bacterium]|nr:class I SAM-dependent methyltransferase [Minwuiales bacterium]
MTIDESKLEAFAGQLVGDLAAAYSGVMANLGHKLGLYKALAGAGSLTSDALAEKTGTHERYVREWLSNQAAGGYVTYDPASQTYALPDEHAMLLADGESAMFVAPAFDVVSSMWHDEDMVADAFRTGRGIGWHEHDCRLFHGVEAFFRPGYKANLTTTWIPALEGVDGRLKQGGKVADVGCGHGASTVIMAEAYPKVRLHGFDYHKASIETARNRAKDAGVEDRVRFDVASAKSYGGKGYDLICFMDCFHDLGDPLGAAQHAREALAPDGTVLMVEPFANDRLEDNLNPVGRLYYAASTSLCTPNSLSQEVGLGLGAQAGQARLTEILNEAGFSHVRRAHETPFNIVLEARL